MNKYLIAALAAAVLSLGWVVDHYHGKAVGWRAMAHWAQKAVNSLAATITDMQVRQEQLAQLDRKHTQELADAYHDINVLQRDVDVGRQQLQLHATCPALPAGTRCGAAGDNQSLERTLIMIAHWMRQGQRVTFTEYASQWTEAQKHRKDGNQSTPEMAEAWPFRGKRCISPGGSDYFAQGVRGGNVSTMRRK
ncbi:hypothetical protein CD006_05625 [Enterobacter sp. 10-1]|uniref:lysis system i-spanin subunit Rz n=1 Tax=Raoultella sp. 10-1 TaxID=2683201 RepID=UPI000BA43387|nr:MULTISPECIES: lysis system i-spanin subunit Rz [Enterobacteriaceae]MVT02138.1 hypothetical protein [Raoultella sp. 10-1]PAC14651.1 hypothetical protein CD006_05625 [Enterobacter sp. 10-1]